MDEGKREIRREPHDDQRLKNSLESAENPFPSLDYCCGHYLSTGLKCSGDLCRSAWKIFGRVAGDLRSRLVLRSRFAAFYL